ncbi:MAG: NAD(P)H-quinone oxidoreductase [Deltaproteobacteria bacterium]|nr:NAD(P)H-quinone oxidoreductase [Deltaproteobacteria bacterium]
MAQSLEVKHPINQKTALQDLFKIPFDNLLETPHFLEVLKTKAIVITHPGDESVLQIQERALRDPGPGEVRVAVAACGLNRADILQRMGLYPPPSDAPQDVPGLEFSGHIEATGPDVRGFREGDPVMGIVSGGAMATHLITHCRMLMPAPQRLGLIEAAAIPEAFLTVWDAFFSQASLHPGMNVLIHAVGSGIGTAALQVGLRTGATLLGTSRSQWKIERAKQMGLQHSLQLLPLPEGGTLLCNWVEEITKKKGVHLILDTLGGPWLEFHLSSLALKGTIVCIGLLDGAKGTLPMAQLLSKRARLIGTLLRTRPIEEKIALTQRFTHEALPLLEDGVLHPVVDRVLPLTAVAEAHRLLAEGKAFGKIVLEVNL